MAGKKIKIIVGLVRMSFALDHPRNLQRHFVGMK